MKKGCLGRTILAGCGKTISALENFDGLHIWAKPGLSGYLVCLVCLVEPDRPNRPDKPNEQVRLAGLFSILLACACTVALVGAEMGQALAAQKKSKEQASSVVPAIAPTPSPELAKKSTRVHAKRTAVSTVPEQQPEVLQGQAKQPPTESKTTGRKGHRPAKVRKKTQPRAVVQPRTDLMYHGMLESPQRYDPRRDHLSAGVPDPHTPELSHDHFQELDRNQDGQIDPVERVFGRLDMDRDLHDRQPR